MTRTPSITFRHLFAIFFLVLTTAPSQGAPYRLNRVSDSALMLYPDNLVSATGDKQGNLHVVYTDSAERKWHIYYRSLRDGFWSVPVRLSTAADILDNRSPQIVFDPATENLYVVWLGLSSGSAVRTYKLFVMQVDPGSEHHSLVKTFDYGLATFRPQIAVSPGRLFLLSEERPEKARSVFHVRVFLTASGEWIETSMQSSRVETVSSPVLGCTPEGAALLWVRTSAQGYDLMVSAMSPAAATWGEPKPFFRSPALPETLRVAVRGKLLSILWTIRGGGRNSIVMHMESRDGGQSWSGPGSLYSAGATIWAEPFAFSEKEILALFTVIDDRGEKLKMKLTTNGGENWSPAEEIDAFDIGPTGRNSTKAQRPSVASLGGGNVLLSWEEWQSKGPTIALKAATLQGLAAIQKQLLDRTTEAGDRFPYYPQLWLAGDKAYVTFGTKRLPQSAMERISASNLYIVEVPAPLARPRRPEGARPVRKLP